MQRSLRGGLSQYRVRERWQSSREDFLGILPRESFYSSRRNRWYWARSHSRILSPNSDLLRRTWLSRGRYRWSWEWREISAWVLNVREIASRLDHASDWRKRSPRLLRSSHRTYRTACPRCIPVSRGMSHPPNPSIPTPTTRISHRANSVPYRVWSREIRANPSSWRLTSWEVSLSR